MLEHSGSTAANPQPAPVDLGLFEDVKLKTTPSDMIIRSHEREIEMIVQAAGGAAHTLFLTSFGRVLGVGSNEFGQLGALRL